MAVTHSAIPASPALAAPPRYGYADLFLISFAILFLELACIRWFGSTVVFLTFFTNIVLMACFLGMTVGCLAAARKANLLKVVLPVLLLAVALAWLVLYAYDTSTKITIDVGNQKTPQEIFFGTEYREKNPHQWVLPVEAVAGVFFVLIALVFVGLGQVMGRAFDAIDNRIGAYTVNIVGSLVGIVGFAACSFLSLSPLVWFLVAAPIVLYLLRHLPRRQFAFQAGALVLVLMAVGISSSACFGLDEKGKPRKYLSPTLVKLLNLVGVKPDAGHVLWSPYYKMYYWPKNGEILTNNITHQHMMNVREWGPAYALPHLLNRDAGGKAFEQVMIIGAGSGNDVQTARRFGAKHIDAVEIDPSIQALGQASHPDRPYDDRERITVHIEDGRSFARRVANEGPRYDLASYALVDSLVLHSGYSSIRLESFLFTQEAFSDIQRTLKPGGVFMTYNYFRQWWVVGRIAAMAKEVFGTEPLVISLPYQAEIKPGDDHKDRFTIVMVGKPDPGSDQCAAVERIRARFEKDKFYWINQRPALNEELKLNGFGPEAPPAVDATAPAMTGFKATDRDDDGEPRKRDLKWWQVGPAKLAWGGQPELASKLPELRNVPKDNWPFLYLATATIPTLSLKGIALIAILSAVILFAFAPVRTIRPNGQMFFLGAGFMLLETKGVVHLALLLGSTWVVNSVVFFAILVLILLANLFVLRFRPQRTAPFYLLLIAALLINALVPMTWFLSLPGAARLLVSCAVVFVPIFFAGVIFATAFRESKHPDVDMGSNIGGVILGGLSEYVSLLVGFNYLIFLAIGFYLLSAALRPRLAAKLPTPVPV